MQTESTPASAAHVAVEWSAAAAGSEQPPPPVAAQRTTSKTAAEKAKASSTKKDAAQGAGARPAKRSPAKPSTTISKQVPLPKTGYASAAAKTTTAELAFLRDASLTPEEKLVLLLAHQKKKVNAEIEALLKKADTAKAAAAAPKKKKGIKLFDAVKKFIPALGITDKVLGGKLDDLLKQISGPMLAAAATAAGLPALAPIAMTLGPRLSEALLQAEVEIPGVTGDGDAKSSSGSSGKGSEVGKLDEADVARLNLLRQRSDEWASLVSNMLHSMHQTRMNLIQNLR